MGFLTKLARSAGRGVVVGSSAALRGGGRILAVHVLPDELVPSWKTQKRLKQTGSVISRTFFKSEESAKKPNKSTSKKSGKTSGSMRTATPGRSSGFGGNHRPPAPAPAPAPLPRSFFRGLPGFNMLPHLRAKKNAAVAARSFLDVNGNVLPVDPNFFDRNIWSRGGRLVSNQDWSKSSRDAVEAAASRVARAGGRSKSFRDRVAAYSSPRPRTAAPLVLPTLFELPAAPRPDLNAFPYVPSRLARSAMRRSSRAAY